MKILFLDQSGKPGGAELCLLDIAQQYGDRALVCLFADGPFRTLLADRGVPVQVCATPLDVQKESTIWQGLASVQRLLPLVTQITELSREYDVIYANTQKALVVGAIASFLSRRPLVYHLHDIISRDHFSAINQRLIVTLANSQAARVIANSQASAEAFVAAGGDARRVQVVYNGFALERYETVTAQRSLLRQALQLENKFVVGHFSRLSPWKGQHVLLEALQFCPGEIVALLVGDALFSETAYVTQLHQQVERLGLGDRVQFLGFRSDIPELMAACDLVAHTSTAPEPFGRVIIEAMLCRTPVVAAAAGGAMELVQPGVTGWLCPPGEARALANVIIQCWQHPEPTQTLAHHAIAYAQSQFDLKVINQQIQQCVQPVCAKTKSCQVPSQV
jgi:glycosyltransferase involved in cell wall biosynthesis